VNPGLIVTAGRLVTGKGIDDLISALPPGARLRILGDGPDADRLKHRVHDLGLRDRVDFLGWIDDVTSAMRDAALAVFPSRLGEGSPVAIVEAMMAGVPVVAADSGGTRELVEDGVTGWLVPPGRPEALRQKIGWAFDHPAAVREISTKAREVARDRFNLDRAADHLIRVYRAALSPCPAPRPG
jgi:1,4-alpha-glucan branching enzyme